MFIQRGSGRLVSGPLDIGLRHPWSAGGELSLSRRFPPHVRLPDPREPTDVRG